MSQNKFNIFTRVSPLVILTAIFGFSSRLISTINAGDMFSDYDRVCGQLDEGAAVNHDNNEENSPTKQKTGYCAAAKGGKTAVPVKSTMVAVHTGVAATCFAACAYPAAQAGCTGADLGGSGAEIAADAGVAAALKQDVGKTLSTSLPGAAISVGQKAATGAFSKGSKAAEKGSDAAKKNKASACISGALHSAQGIMQGVNIGTDKKNFDKNLTSAENLNSNSNENTLAPVAPDVSFNQNSGGGNQALNQSTAQTSFNKLSGTTSTNSTNSSCENAVKNADSVATLTCAAQAGGMNLPPEYSSQKFLDNVKNLTGMSLGEMAQKIANGADPAQLMSQALAGTVDGASSQKIAALLSKAESDLKSNASSNGSNPTMMASRGSASGATSNSESSSESPDDDLAKLMQELMSQVNPADGSTDPNATAELTPETIEFKAYHGRSPASVVDDPKLNIFNRVSIRYLVMAKKNKI